MRNLIATARSALRRTAARPPGSIEEARRRTDRNVVMKLSRGNLRIQCGQYSTSADIEHEYEQIRDLKVDGS